ncbi:CGNR zinc finger domain-containing protein [Pseudonocardia sp. CA-107938]|uniref:CGNR zinc finger domain-containing protein n=1 Tax=Pseudonocardia sp. CA-107938 TaxID=3240021 RepID=UPI003D923189
MTRHSDDRRWRSGRPCLDLVHSGGAPEQAVHWEIVHGPADLTRLLPRMLHADLHVSATDADVVALRELRTAVARIAYAVADGRSPADPGLAEHVAVVNRVAAGAPLVPVLDGETSAFVDPTAAQALATLARDAVDLFGSPLRSRVRVCAAPDCGLLLLDTSRPGNRRWCSMQRCGTLAKVRSHRAREAGR